MVLHDGPSLSSQLRTQQEVILTSNCHGLSGAEKSQPRWGEHPLGRRHRAAVSFTQPQPAPPYAGLTLCRDHWKHVHTGRELLCAR